MKSKILSSSLLVVGFLLGASALSALAAWSVPACTPPGCNTDAPINASTSAQVKWGSLEVNRNLVDSIGLIVGNKIKIFDDSAAAGTAAGKVLTSDANGVGTWQSLGAVAGTSIIECTSTGASGIRKNFVASDCTGGVLPDSSYYGAFKGVTKMSGTDVGLITLRIFDNDGASGPGFLVYYFSGGPVQQSYEVTAVYIKPGGSGSGSQKGLVVGGFENVNATVPATAWGDCSAATNIVEVGVSSNAQLNFLCIHK